MCVCSFWTQSNYFAKEPYKRDYSLQNRPIILKSLLIVGYPYVWVNEEGKNPRGECENPQPHSALLESPLARGLSYDPYSDSIQDTLVTLLLMGTGALYRVCSTGLR